MPSWIRTWHCQRRSQPHSRRASWSGGSSSSADGKIDNFAIIAGRKPGKIRSGTGDSDLYKLIEAAAYTLAWRRDVALETRVDGIIELIAAAQDKDGYLNTHYALPPEHPASPPLAQGKKAGYYGLADRWKGTVESWPKGICQLYCAGHLFEAAAAYYRATGKRALLDVSIKFADHIYLRFPPGQPIDYADHPQIEIGLVKLFEVTGGRRYLELANHLARNGSAARPPDLGNGENRKPLAKQRKAWGHAVRINYLYSGATDVCRYSDQPDLREALDSLWHSIVDRRSYVHGGVGGPAGAEQIADDWILDPAGTYSECCANIAHGQWNHALNLFKADASFADLVEIEAYNGGLVGISLDGNKFFYSNVLTAGIAGRSNPHSGVRTHYLFCCPSKVPKQSSDKTQPRLAWWPHVGSTQWAQCEFVRPESVKGVSVFWFADHPKGGCKLPESWRLLYHCDDNNNWKPVPGATGYGLAPDQFNRVSFPQLEVKSLLLEVKLQPKSSGGIHEWGIEPDTDG